MTVDMRKSSARMMAFVDRPTRCHKYFFPIVLATAFLAALKVRNIMSAFVFDGDDNKNSAGRLPTKHVDFSERNTTGKNGIEYSTSPDNELIPVQAIDNDIKQVANLPNASTTLQSHPTSRPLLIFKHYPKAGGGSIKKLLLEFKPNQYLRKDLYEEKLHNITFRKQNQSSEERDDFNFINPDNSLVIINELEKEPISIHDHKMGFVISNMREPCSQYVSLWAFGSIGKGGLYRELLKKDYNWTLTAYGQDPPTYESERDVQAFRRWLKSRHIANLVTKRFEQSFGKQVISPHGEDSSSAIRSTAMPDTVDCWVFVDDFQATLYSCLKQFEDQGGAVDWNEPLISAIAKKIEKEADQQKYSRALLEEHSKNNPLSNPQLSNHGTCSTYFDDETSKFVEEGQESFIYEMFRYKGCCKRGRQKF